MAQINPNAELKSQVLNYLKVYKLEVELLINFGSKSFHFKDSYSEMKSVKSLNPFKSVIQKSYDYYQSAWRDFKSGK